MEQNTAAAARKSILEITEALAAHARRIRRRFTATFVDRFVPAGVRVQKSAFRTHLGLLLPVRCPTCRMYTKQRPAVTREFRVCLSCGVEFSKHRVRRQNRLDGVRGIPAPFGSWR